MWYKDEGLFTILQNVKHFKLRIHTRFPDSNTSLYFLSRIRKTLTSLELLQDVDRDANDFFVGKLPFLNESEILLPELIHLTVSGHGLEMTIEDIESFRNDEIITSEEAERMVQNVFTSRKLVCPKLEHLTIKQQQLGRPSIVSLRSLESLKTLKLATNHPNFITDVLSQVPKIENVKFELLHFQSAIAINKFTLSEFCFPFEVEIDLSDYQDGCGKEVENLLKDFKENNDGGNETKSFCKFEINSIYGQILRKGLSLAEWWELYDKLEKWHKKTTRR